MGNLAIAIVVILVLVAVNRLGKRPAKYGDLDTPSLRSLLELLYVRGLDGGFLHVATRASYQVVRVYKFIRRPEHVELEVHVPKETYLPIGAEQIKSALEAEGFTALIAGGGAEQWAGDLVVDCGPQISRALVALEFLLRNVLRLDPELQCIAHIERADANPRGHPGFAAAPRF